jgi:hypothetical protein
MANGGVAMTIRYLNPAIYPDRRVIEIRISDYELGRSTHMFRNVGVVVTGVRKNSDGDICFQVYNADFPDINDEITPSYTWNEAKYKWPDLFDRTIDHDKDLNWWYRSTSQISCIRLAPWKRIESDWSKEQARKYEILHRKFK